MTNYVSIPQRGFGGKIAPLAGVTTAPPRWRNQSDGSSIRVSALSTRRSGLLQSQAEQHGATNLYYAPIRIFLEGATYTPRSG